MRSSRLRYCGGQPTSLSGSLAEPDNAVASSRGSGGTRLFS